MEERKIFEVIGSAPGIKIGTIYYTFIYKKEKLVTVNGSSLDLSEAIRFNNIFKDISNHKYWAIKLTKDGEYYFYNTNEFPKRMYGLYKISKEEYLHKQKIDELTKIAKDRYKKGDTVLSFIGDKQVITDYDIRVIKAFGGYLVFIGSVLVYTHEYYYCSNDDSLATGDGYCKSTSLVTGEGRWLEIVPKEVIFKTDDSVDIYEGDKFYSVRTKAWVDNKRKIVSVDLWTPTESKATKGFIKDADGVYRFSTKELAEKFIYNNEPIYSRIQLSQKVKTEELISDILSK